MIFPMDQAGKSEMNLPTVRAELSIEKLVFQSWAKKKRQMALRISQARQNEVFKPGKKKYNMYWIKATANANARMKCVFQFSLQDHK